MIEDQMLLSEKERIKEQFRSWLRSIFPDDSEISDEILADFDDIYAKYRP